MRLLAGRPWRRGMTWLLVLAPLFFLSYGWANHRAAAQPHVPSIVFGWEAHIPLWPWTILPYWSIDLFYGLSLLLARTRQELDRHAARLLAAQGIAVACFALWPLRYAVARPPLAGWSGALFDALAGFDLPYNQAPSLHIVLLLILWDFYRRHTTGWLRAGVHVWSLLIGVSVLTTWQHHFIDVPTGVLAALACMWAFPLDGPLPRWQPHGARGRWALAAAYGGGAIACVATAIGLGLAGHAVAWWGLWPAVALAWVASAYAGWGEAAFQKNGRGELSVAAAWIMAPYRALAWLNARCWTWRGEPASPPVRDRVSLGRLPLPWETTARGHRQVLDLTAELSARHPGLRCVPMLDLVVPAPERLVLAAGVLRQMAASGDPVLVCCALGFSRSAAVVATWLCLAGHAQSVDEAIALVRQVRRQIVVRASLREAIVRAVQLAHSGPVAVPEVA